MGNEKPENVVMEKSLAFSVRIVNLCRLLRFQRKEYILSNQLMRSGTSIGANAAEANDSISKKDFLNKMYIALKESSETLYWIELLHRTDYLTDREYDSIVSDCRELHRILSSITKTTKESLD